MKKITITLCAAAALFFVNASSVWEGAASVASGGILPETGYYAATNSFPRNTIVDITNLETNRTIRVIVAAGLDTPGLLVILSKDAADAVGLLPRTVGRVRMIQPADPVAFSRFTENRATSGDPDNDTAALVAAEAGMNPDIEAEAAALADEAAAAKAEALAAEQAKAIEEQAALAETEAAEEAEALAAEPAKSAEEQAILAETEAAEEAEVLAAEQPKAAEEQAALAETEAAEETEVLAAEQPKAVEEQAALAAAVEPETAETPETAEPVIAGIPPLETDDEDIVPEPVPELAFTEPEIPGDGLAVETYEPEPFVPGPQTAAEPEKEAETPFPWTGEVELALEPAEKRTPEESPALISPDDMIDPPVRAANPSGGTPPPAAAQQLPVPAAGFSAPVITSLEKGKYYIQVAAMSKHESIENEIAKIGNNMPIALQHTGTEEKPVYRILIGPVNLGESGALLRRYKATYKDAFVRVGN